MWEQDKRFLERIYEYARRYWKMPAPCLYLWDRYGLETKLVNRQSMICRADVDYAYDDDFNLHIINTLNTTSPFVGQTLTVESVAYNSDGEIEPGHLVLYIKYEDDEEFHLLEEAPYSFTIMFKKDFDLVTKYYTLDESDYAETIDINDEVNISEPVEVHVRDYTDADYYVADYGDDNNTGSIDLPFKTLQHAINMVNDGGTVCLLTDLDLTNSVLLFKDCNIIGKENRFVESVNGLYLTILSNTRIYIQNIILTKENIEVYNFSSGHYILNNGGAIVTVESPDIKPVPVYDLDLVSSDYWINGQEVIITLKDKTDLLIDVNAYLFDSYNALIGVINCDGSETYNVSYTVPTGLETDKILLVIPKNNYSFNKLFKVYNIDSDWYVDTENGSDTNSGLSIDDAFATLEYALNHVEKLKNIVFFRGNETINNLIVSNDVFIHGLMNMSILSTDSDSYFRISSDCYLNINDVFLDYNLIENTSFSNNSANLLDVLSFNKGNVLFVDGTNGDDNNHGTSWFDALKSLRYALGLYPDLIYFSGKNTIEEYLLVHEDVEIIGSLNNSEIYTNTDTYFSIEKGKVLKLSNINLNSVDENNYIKKDTYINNGTNPLKVVKHR